MKVILREAVPKLGKAGDIKEVRMGYGFNFLLPKGLAELATEGNVKRVGHEVERQAKKRTLEGEKLEAAVTKLNKQTITITMKAHEGKLFGSVGKTLIIEALKKEKIDVDEEVLVLNHPLKSVGSHAVEAKAGKAEAKFTVIVAVEK